MSFQKKGYKEFHTRVHLDEENRVRDVTVTLIEQTAAEKAAEEKKRKQGTWEDSNYLDGSKKIVANVVIEDGNVVPGVAVALYRDLPNNSRVTVAHTATNENGTAIFNRLPIGKYVMLFELEGFKKVQRRVTVSHSDVNATIMLEMSSIKQEVQCVGNAATSIAAVGEPAASVWKSSDFHSLLRKDFKENLFFQIVETDDTGTAELTF
ncbi:MAG: carboxypeptidase regulatory-like domain-containing protein, partial [bacterium]|nr:carboxypeptidase regulatory-like domain-containing protein [bacterium]